MAKIIITFLLFAVQIQAQNTWVSGGGGDTTGIVHNAVKIKGVPVSLIPPTDNFILKYDSSVDSFLLEIDDTGAGGQWTDFGTYLKPIDDADVALHLGDTADNDSLIIAIDGNGNVTFTTTTGNIIFTTGNTGNSAFQLPASSVSSTEILNATIQGEDLQTGAIDSIGKLGDGLWNSAAVVTFASGADTVLFRDATDGSIVKGVISTGGGGLDSVFTSISVDSIENRTNASTTQIIVTDSIRFQDHIVMTTLDLDTFIIALDGVSETNSFVAGTRFFNYMDGATSLFAIDTTGAIITGSWGATSISDGNVDDNITVTSYLLLTTILDSLNNYDNDIIFTQGNASYAANSVSSDELNATGVESELEAVMDLEDMQGAVTDGQVPNNITVTNYLLLAAILDSLNNYDGDILFTQGVTTYSNFLDSLNNYDNDVLFTQGITLLAANSVSANELNATGVEAELEAVLDLPELQGLLISTQVDSVGGNGIVTHTQLAEYDTLMVELPAAVWDTTATQSGSLDFLETSGFRESFWSFATVTSDTLTTQFDLPDFFSSFVRIQVVLETEDTTADTMFLAAEGFADDEPHAVDVTLATSGAATFHFNTVSTANDINIAEDFSISGTYSSGDHIHFLLRRASTDEGVIRFLGMKIYILRTL